MNENSPLTTDTSAKHLLLPNEDQKELEVSIKNLQARINEKKIGSHFLRAINVLQRLIEKYLREVKRMMEDQRLKDEGVIFLAENVLN